jgi:hypothetical protein
MFGVFPNYTIPGIQNSNLATIVAGILGLIIVFGVTITIGRMEKRTTIRE